MELWNLNEIKLNKETSDLLNNIDEVARQVNEYRPLPDDVVRRILDDLESERVYNSNAIEGNTLDLRETKEVLQAGIGRVESKRETEAMEARNLGEAVKLVSDWVASGVGEHTLDNLLKLHHLVLKEINDNQAGRFRTARVMVDGAKHQPPNVASVPVLMTNMFSLLRDERRVHDVVAAAWVHWAIARIHPFYDGNGRVARLWQDLVLLQSRLTCAIIRPEDRREYLEALTQADENEFNPLIQLVCQRTHETLDKYLSHIGHDALLDEWVIELVGEAQARSSEPDKLEFAKWRQKMVQLRWEFEVCSSRVSKASKDLQIQVNECDIININRWDNIRSGMIVGPTSFFSMDFSVRHVYWRYYFFFGLHSSCEHDSMEDKSQQRVGLLISELEGSGLSKHLIQADDSPVSLREVFLTDDRFIRKSVDSSGSALTYDRNIAPIDIAKDFISDVILKRMS